MILHNIVHVHSYPLEPQLFEEQKSSRVYMECIISSVHIPRVENLIVNAGEFWGLKSTHLKVVKDVLVHSVIFLLNVEYDWNPQRTGLAKLPYIGNVCEAKQA